jgi:predicted HAD superfamily phosphohydrolase YqeG
MQGQRPLRRGWKERARRHYNASGQTIVRKGDELATGVLGGMFSGSTVLVRFLGYKSIRTAYFA